jgi:pyruvate/2-oxoglutarate dehydrogenase complex dihydrolipoamide acyltransferase (E2) component
MAKQENPVSEVIPMRGWRKTLAERMIDSHLKNAEVTQMREIDASTLVDLRQSLVGRLEKEHGFRLSYTHLIIKAVAQALTEHPIMNSSLVDDEIRIYGDVNIGMAVALESGGLLTPVIRQADKKSIVEVAQQAIEAAGQVRSRRFDLGILYGGTFTVTNAGMFGTDFVTPLIPIPQVAALGVGKLATKPVAKDGEIVVGKVMGLSLTYDHRVVSGATAARFFQAVEEVMASPGKLNLGI